IARLQAYLGREYSRQPVSNRIVLLWASTRWPGLIDQERRRSLVDEILSEQQSDGGWSLSSLARSSRAQSLRSYVRSWIRNDRTLVGTRSDGYATGLVTFVLSEAGVPRDNVRLEKGLSWLRRNQNSDDGSW